MEPKSGLFMSMTLIYILNCDTKTITRKTALNSMLYKCLRPGLCNFDHRYNQISFRRSLPSTNKLKRTYMLKGGIYEKSSLHRPHALLFHGKLKHEHLKEHYRSDINCCVDNSTVLNHDNRKKIEINTDTISQVKAVEVTNPELTKNSLEEPPLRELKSSLNVDEPFEHLRHTLDATEHKFYNTTFLMLSSNSPIERRENGISFTQSGLFLYLTMVALSMMVDESTRHEIEQHFPMDFAKEEKLANLKKIVSNLPKSTEHVKFRWSSRLVLSKDIHISEEYKNGYFGQLLKIDYLNETQDPEVLTNVLNEMIEEDSGGAMRDTFEIDELSTGVRAALLTTVYVRGEWRSAPTLLNGSHTFYDAHEQRSCKMLRVNDIVGYARLDEIGAVAIELQYATPGLTLLLIVPHNTSLRHSASLLVKHNIHGLVKRLKPMRAAVTMPLYTLRMTLLLPSKLRDMGVTKILEETEDASMLPHQLRLSHAVQRIMFWSEAGRNAFKDDGIEWEEPPDIRILVDRPYVFYVRWHNITVVSGNFVL